MKDPVRIIKNLRYNTTDGKKSVVFFCERRRYEYFKRYRKYVFSYRKLNVQRLEHNIHNGVDF
jgi:ribosomal protein S17